MTDIITNVNTDLTDLSLDELKQEYIEILKTEVAPAIVEDKAPEYKQRNVSLGLEDESTKALVINWIKATKIIVEQLEEQINNVEDVESLNDIDITYESVYALVENKMQELGVSLRVISKYAFRKRLTQEEKIAIDNFEMNPNISDDDKMILRSFFKDFEFAIDIDLDDEDLRNGLLYLEQLGLLTEGRTDEILA